MAGPVAKLYATLGLDNRGFLQGLTQSQSALGKFGGAVAGGLGFGAGFGGFMLLQRGIAEVVDGFGDVVTAASNMTETQTKLDQVFMHSADTMRDWSEGAAQTMIMSEQAALASAATFGNFLQALGQTEEASASMSQQLVMLSADLASYNNLAGGAEEATMRLFSGMSGEMEAVRRLGIDLSETAVSTYLLANGVKRVGMQFRQSDKTAARFALIMKDTAKAQGDVERTGENLANRQREFNAEVGNLQAALGAGMVGPMADFTGWLADVVGMFSGDDSLNRKIDEFTGRIYGLADAAGEAGKGISDGLGILENTIADTPGLDFLFPAIANQTKFWRENHVVLQQAGFDFYSLGGFIDDLTSKQHLSNEAAQAQVIAFTKFDAANRRLAAGVAKTNRENWSFIQGFRDTSMDQGQAGQIFDAVLGAFDSFQTGWTIGKDDMVDTIRQTFADARAAIRAGFGSVKDALQGGTGIVDPETRLRNMGNRFAAAQKNLRKAQQIGDPIGESKWRAAVAKQRLNMDTYRDHTRGVFRDIKKDTTDKARETADKMIEEARRGRDAVSRVFSYERGAQIMQQFYGGMRSVTPVLANTGPNLGAVSPAMMGEGRGGVTVNFNGHIYGGPAGQRELMRELTRIMRLSSRER